MFFFFLSEGDSNDLESRLSSLKALKLTAFNTFSVNQPITFIDTKDNLNGISTPQMPVLYIHMTRSWLYLQMLCHHTMPDYQKSHSCQLKLIVA